MNLSQINPVVNYGIKGIISDKKDVKSPIMSSPLSSDVFTKSAKISFCGKNEFKKISDKELERVCKEVEKKASDLSITLYPYWYKNKGGANISAQLINALLSHKVIENESVRDKVELFMAIDFSTHAREISESILDFADFITSDEVRDVYECESVKNHLGQILFECRDFSLSSMKQMVKYINSHKELLNNKDLDLGRYIECAKPSTCNHLISSLQKIISPWSTPTKEFDDLKNYNNPKEVTKEHKVESKGEIIEKKSGEISGFARIGGQDEAVEALERLVIFPKKFPKIFKGRNLEKGAILYGPPGTGKSLMATALAEEYGAYCVKIGASEMSERWVGSSEENWRNLFEDLKEHQPALLFIDEIDALCKKRGGGDVYGDKELNQFLKLVSDIKAENLDVFILGATNDYEALDPAVLRDGRLGIHIEMLPPKNIKDVEAIFNIHTHDLDMDEDVEVNKGEIFQQILDLGLTGSGIEALVNEAHTQALERMGLFEKMKNDIVEQSDIDAFCIKAQDFLNALEERCNSSENNEKIKIGF